MFWTAIATMACACACGGSPAGPSAGATLKVMTFNIQHGIDGSEKYQLQSAIATIARVPADIVGLQEVTRNHPYYNCDDQPAAIAAGVRALTGQSWDVTYQQEWFTPDRSCEQSGRGSGPETEGLVLMTRRPATSPLTTLLVDSRIGFQRNLTDVGLPVVVTHLTSGDANGSVRARQVSQLVSWTAAFGEPRIIMGDFNLHPDEPELQPMLSAYHDAWTDAVRGGMAVGTGLTHSTVRIDYIFYVPGSRMTLQSVEVVDPTTFIGREASDHRPVVATFAIR